MYNIAWYEQKAFIVLLALLSLGIKDIHVGPTLPAFLSPNVAKVLIDTFGLAGIDTVQKDIALFLGADAGAAEETIKIGMTIGDILRVDAGLSEVLTECGMHCLGCPSSQVESLEDACSVHNMNPEAVLARLNAHLNK